MKSTLPINTVCSELLDPQGSGPHHSALARVHTSHLCEHGGSLLPRRSADLEYLYLGAREWNLLVEMTCHYWCL
ncbi:hypothetical protein M8J76_003421 [Diaphorina citri]|nr:hypothetical protein M8J76_003421 [Diaphorina citri]